MISEISSHIDASLGCESSAHTEWQNIIAGMTVEQQENYYVIQYKVVRNDEMVQGAYVGPLNKIKAID